MRADLCLVPEYFDPANLDHRTVVVFDVLRATTTMLAAFAHGVREIHLFDSPENAMLAAAKADPRPLLCGERECLPPAGFDLGNSPAGFTPSHAARTVYMSTTNGTRAILAVGAARTILIAAMVNARATARYMATLGQDIALVCAGTNKQPAMEDVLGAGAVIHELVSLGKAQPASDPARMALRLFLACRTDLAGAMADSQGGRNVIAAGLPADIGFAADLNRFDIAAGALPDPLRVVRLA
jgi:2-phosphosulfolactate phosphatase